MHRYSPRDILVLAGIALLFLWQLAPGLLGDPRRLLVFAGAIILAITVHEFSHALAAHLLGDHTPASMGRLTLNPLAHLDPMGTVLLFIAQFGWGKPVQFNPYNLRINPAVGSAAVSFAGPLSNILLAMLLTLVARYTITPGPLEREILSAAIRINIGLAAFNLLPIPPLDGFGVLEGVLPRQFGRVLEPLRAYGPFILLALVFLPSLGGPNVIGALMGPILGAITTLVRGV